MDDIPSVEDIVGINFFYMTSTLLTAQWLGSLHDEAYKITRRMFS